MPFLYLIGALGLVLLVLDRLVDLPWWAQLVLLAGSAVAMVAYGGGTFWAVPGAIYFAILLTTAQAGTVEYLRAAQLETVRRKTRRTAVPW